MNTDKINIGHIPALVWGRPSQRAYIFVHGKMSSKEAAERFAQIAEEKGFQTLSFDLPRHGERQASAARCDIWNALRELPLAADYAFANWREVSLYACSLGAYFSLNAYPGLQLRKCLFQSPILDMEYLIRQMMLWFDVPEDRLAREKEVDTPIDVLSWEYYQYVKAHPVRQWEAPTSILFGGKDNLQTLDIMERFTHQFHCKLTVAENSEHPFMEKEDGQIVDRWLQENI